MEREELKTGKSLNDTPGGSEPVGPEVFSGIL